jgi:antitoxin YefM
MPLAIMMWSRAAMASAYTTRHTCPEAAKGTSSSDAEPTIICGDQGQKAVLLSLEEFNSWQETLYLLSNPANAEHLRQSIAEAQTGKTLERDLIDP